MSVIAFVFARGGSKGIPRKNLQRLGGKPLLAWSIEVAQACPDVARVIVSTDDAEIAETARRYGAEVPFIRPSDLAADNSPEWLSWRHAIEFVNGETGSFEIFLSVPTTSPLRHPDDLKRAIATLRTGDCDAVVSITPAARNPFFNMVHYDRNGYLAVVAGTGDKVPNRQTAPQVFDMTTVVYAAKPDYVLAAPSLFRGRVKGIIVPKERALDIDDKLDFQFAEFMLQRHSLSIDQDQPL